MAMKCDASGRIMSTSASICYSCSVCNCEWHLRGKPVPGWVAEPSKIPMYARKGGLRVVACPKMKPFKERQCDDQIAPEPPRRRYEKRKSAIY